MSRPVGVTEPDVIVHSRNDKSVNKELKKSGKLNKNLKNTQFKRLKSDEYK